MQPAFLLWWAGVFLLAERRSVPLLICVLSSVSPPGGAFSVHQLVLCRRNDSSLFTRFPQVWQRNSCDRLTEGNIQPDCESSTVDFSCNCEKEVAQTRSLCWRSVVSRSAWSLLSQAFPKLATWIGLSRLSWASVFFPGLGASWRPAFFLLQRGRSTACAYWWTLTAATRFCPGVPAAAIVLRGPGVSTYQKVAPPCYCFGAGQNNVTAIDIWRNVGFLCCAGGEGEALL